MKALDIEKMNEYFKSLEETLEQRTNQGRFTMWMELVSHLITALQMSLQEEAKKKFVIESLGIRGRLLTVVGCSNAAGQAIPPYVIFDAKC